MTTIRQERVARMLFEELSIMVGGELSDPDLSLVSVTDVIITRDLRNAKIFVSHDDDEVSNSQVLRALKRAAPYMRGQIAERCGLRMVPELLFSYDETPIRADRINELLAQIAAEKERKALSSEGDDDAVGLMTETDMQTGTETGTETGAQSESGSETGQ